MSPQEPVTWKGGGAVRRPIAMILTLVIGLSCSGCSRQEPKVLSAWSLDDLTDVIARDDAISIDEEITVDGGGSLYIKAGERRVVKLFEVRDLAVEDAVLTYSAFLKCMSLGGNAYLEMWCRIPGQGESYSRGLDTAVNRSDDWTESQTLFFLDKGQVVDRVRLNVVIEGSGHVWVDNLKLTVGPRPRN